jgi:hypothetical protein
VVIKNKPDLHCAINYYFDTGFKSKKSGVHDDFSSFILLYCRLFRIDVAIAFPQGAKLDKTNSGPPTNTLKLQQDYSKGIMARDTRKTKLANGSAHTDGKSVEMDDSASANRASSKGNFDESALGHKTTPKMSHRERRKWHQADVGESDPPVESHPPDDLDDIERPGAHRVNNGETHDDEGNTVIFQEPEQGHEQDHRVPAEAATVVAWVVQPQVAQASSVSSKSDVEEPAAIPEAVVQKGLAVWIQGHMTLTVILIAVFVAAVVVPLTVILSRVPTGEYPTMAPTPSDTVFIDTLPPTMAPSAIPSGTYDIGSLHPTASHTYVVGTLSPTPTPSGASLAPTSSESSFAPGTVGPTTSGPSPTAGEPSSASPTTLDAEPYRPY